MVNYRTRYDEIWHSLYLGNGFHQVLNSLMRSNSPREDHTVPPHDIEGSKEFCIDSAINGVVHFDVSSISRE